MLSGRTETSSRLLTEDEGMARREPCQGFAVHVETSFAI